MESFDVFYVSLTCQLTTLRCQLVTVLVGWTRTTTHGSVPITARLIHANVQRHTTLEQHMIGLSLTWTQPLNVALTASLSRWRLSRVCTSHLHLSLGYFVLFKIILAFCNIVLTVVLVWLLCGQHSCAISVLISTALQQVWCVERRSLTPTKEEVNAFARVRFSVCLSAC